jgi:hypothetical protein
MVTVKLIGNPEQPFFVGVTVIVPVISKPVALAGAVHELILPEPDETKPMDVLLFVHVYIIPVILPVKAGTVIVAPGHVAMSLNCVTVGVGYIVTLKLIVLPIHPFVDVGVTVIVPVMFDAVPLVGAVQYGISPDPDAPKPIDVLLFVHVYVVPVRLLEKAGTVMVALGHTAISPNCVTVGVGYIVTLKLIVLPIQPLAEVGVTVIVPVMFDIVPLDGAVHEGILFPDPEAPKPMNVLLFVHVYVVPVRLLEKAGTVMVAPGQTAILLNCVAVGVG